MAKNKVKTHKGASKRFKITGTGKVLHRSPTLRHLRTNKSAGQLRRLKTIKEIVHKEFKDKVHKLLGLK
jgi:large subunit ribosomal protein L35